MGYDELVFADLELRENGIRRLYVDKESSNNKEIILCVDTDDNCYIEVPITTYEQTRKALEKELSLQVEEVTQIHVTLEYFDQNWSEINEYVNEPVVGDEGQEE